MIDSVDKITPIELDASNPFVNGQQIVFTDGSGILMRDQVDYTPKEGDTYHTAKANDNLYSIAYTYYKNEAKIPSRWWWIIADANKDLIFNPLDISALIGKELLIPNLTNFRLLN